MIRAATRLVNKFKQEPSVPLPQRRLLGLTAGTASGACFGVMVFLVHVTSGKVPASEVTFLRAICAVVLLLPFIARHGIQWLRQHALLLWTRSLIGAFSVLCLAWNLQHTSVGFANTLFNFAPIVVVILGALFGHEKIEPIRFVSILLVVAAGILFWHGSRSETSVVIWLVGLSGMSAAAIAYTLLKSLPSSWSPFDVTWCLSVATLPVALIFKHGQWVAPSGNVRWMVVAICMLSLAGYALVNFSFRHLELSTATALVPSAIIWGVLLDIKEHNYPAASGVVGCLLYVGAIICLAVRPSVAILNSQLADSVEALAE